MIVVHDVLPLRIYHAIPMNQVQVLKTGKEAPQHLPIPLFRPSSFTDSPDCLLSSNLSKRTTLRRSLAIEAGRVPDASNVPLPGGTSRREIRLLRETRSVFEYLYQHPLALKFTDKGQPYSFPRIAVLGYVDQVGG